MTNKEYIEEWLKDEYALNPKDREVLTAAIKALEKLDQITAIIHNTQGIQEDVIRYKMICEVMENV